MKAEIKPFDSEQEYFFDEGCFITELSNTENDAAASIVRARVEPLQTTKWHCLHGITERYVITEGKGLVEVGDMPATEVFAGDVVIIPPTVKQRISNIGEVDLVFLAICSPRFVEAAYESLE